MTGTATTRATTRATEIVVPGTVEPSGLEVRNLVPGA